MKEYIATGTLTLSGVTFYISAKSLDDAWARLNTGDHDSADTEMAQYINCEIDLDTIEENV